MPNLPYLKAWLKREQEAKKEARQRVKKAREEAQQHARTIKEIKLQLALLKPRKAQEQEVAVA